MKVPQRAYYPRFLVGYRPLVGTLHHVRWWRNHRVLITIIARPPRPPHSPEHARGSGNVSRRPPITVVQRSTINLIHHFATSNHGGHSRRRAARQHARHLAWYLTRHLARYLTWQHGWIRLGNTAELLLEIRDSCREGIGMLLLAVGEHLVGQESARMCGGVYKRKIWPSWPSKRV